MGRNIDEFANERSNTAPALASLLPELLHRRLRKFNRDSFHGAHSNRVTQTCQIGNTLTGRPAGYWEFDARPR